MVLSKIPGDENEKFQSSHKFINIYMYVYIWKEYVNIPVDMAVFLIYILAIDVASTFSKYT